MHKWTVRLVSVWVVTLLSVTAVIAQDTCAALIEEAFVAVDDNCEDIDRNAACYGFDLVEASFLSEVDDDFFAAPADVASIAEIETIATTALNEVDNTWGVAVMNIQANVPNTLPGQNVTFVLMGDTEVENAVAPEDAFQPSEGIEVTVSAPQGGNVRSGPGLNFNVVGAVANNSTIVVDAQSTDGAWFRIGYRDRIAWVNEVVLTDTTPLADLPVITPELRTAMQAFYVKTGIGEVDCEDAPDDILLIQGPDNIEIELTINGANVQLGSTIGVRTPVIDDETFLEVITFDGTVLVEGVRVPPTYHTLLCLGDDDRDVECEPSTPEPVNGFGEAWCSVEGVPASVLNYGIEVLCPGEAPPVVPTSPPPPSTDDTDDTTETTEETVEIQNNSQLAEVDCSTFVYSGPYTITPRPTLFQWTAAPGATDYELVFWNVGDNVVAGTFWTQNTEMGVHVGEVPTGGTMALEVRAYRNGAYACVTPRTNPIQRSPDPGDGSASSGNFTASLGCRLDDRTDYWVATISWSGAAPGDTVTITGTPVEANGTESMTSNSSSGSHQISGSYIGINNIEARTSSGQSISLGSCN